MPSPTVVPHSLFCLLSPRLGKLIDGEGAGRAMEAGVEKQQIQTNVRAPRERRRSYGFALRRRRRLLLGALTETLAAEALEALDVA